MVEDNKEDKEDKGANSDDLNDKEGSSKENSAPNSEKNSEKSIVDEAREERKLLEAERAKADEARKKLETAQAREEMAGKSKGTSPIEKTEMDKYVERTEQRYKGTGLNPAQGYKRKFE